MFILTYDACQKFRALTFELVVIWINNFEILLRDPARRLVLVHAEDGLEHLHHLLFRLVPHRGRGVDASDVVRRLGLGVVRVRRVRVVRYRLIILWLKKIKQNK